jgi:hypothetical protein
MPRFVNSPVVRSWVRDAMHLAVIAASLITDVTALFWSAPIHVVITTNGLAAWALRSSTRLVGQRGSGQLRVDSQGLTVSDEQRSSPLVEQGFKMGRNVRN